MNVKHEMSLWHLAPLKYTISKYNIHNKITMFKAYLFINKKKLHKTNTVSPDLTPFNYYYSEHGMGC